MDVGSWLLSALVACAAATGSPAASADELGVERFGLYVAVDDVDRTAAFYERLFGEEPQVRRAGFVGFDLAGGLYAVVSKRHFQLAPTPGGATRPYLKVRDIDAAFRRAQALAPDALETRAVVGEGAFRFFRLKDPEGNVVELFAIGSAG
jgi:predicted enzyme related to lactoylglutathione lyase